MENLGAESQKNLLHCANHSGVGEILVFAANTLNEAPASWAEKKTELIFTFSLRTKPRKQSNLMGITTKHVLCRLIAEMMTFYSCSGVGCK